MPEYERTDGEAQISSRLFVAGVVAYTNRSQKGWEAVMNYIDSSEKLTTSDILKFISDQADFFECSV